MLDASVPMTRALYRPWDDQPSSWDGRPVGPHFVHLPPALSRPSGLWAEVGVDGVVVYERELRVSHWLVEVRRHIAAGRIERRHAHGQPYWVESTRGA